jgi:hypothetical protein
MSARRPQPPRPSVPEPDIPEDEEVDFDEDEGFDEGPDLMDVLGGFLATEDGETIATSLAAMKDARAGNLPRAKSIRELKAALNADD